VAERVSVFLIKGVKLKGKQIMMRKLNGVNSAFWAAEVCGPAQREGAYEH